MGVGNLLFGSLLFKIYEVLDYNESLLRVLFNFFYGCEFGFVIGM